MSVKAFQLLCLVEQEQLVAPVVSGDKLHHQQLLQIESLECCGYDLYLGSSDGSVLRLLLEEKSQPITGQTTLTASRQRQRTLSSQRKPVTELRAASALHRLLVLCDNIISLADMSTLEPVAVAGARIKGATTFTLNENPASGGDPFCVELCLISAKRRAIQIFLVYEDHVQIVKEVVTPEQPCLIAADGHFLCLALSSQYIIMNYNTGSSQDLFPYNSEEKRPIVKRISRQEFLLAGPGGLGMFATVAGISQRAPIRWSENVISAAVCFPYVVALDKEFITVHSMLDQQKKQTIPFKEGHILQDFEGRLLATTTNGIYILAPIPLETQIQDLLAGRRVDEALVLANGARRNIPKERFQVMYRQILQQSGFIQFAQLQFSEARELFRSSHLDVRELISLYPFLLPTSSTFGRCHPPLHEYADLNQLTQGDQEKIGKCKQFLISYLKETRSTEVTNGYKEDVDTALLKLYAEANHESLLDLLVSENACILTDCAAWLEKHKRYYALGLLYHYNSQDAAALQLWVKIVNGDLQDTARSDLFEYIVDFLTFCTDQELVWKYSDWVLQKSEQIGVHIFTRRHYEEQKEDGFCPDNVLNCLKKYPKALLKYLEHLVLDRGLKKEKYHTYLALMYLEEVIRLKSLSAEDSGELVELRKKFRGLLQQSDIYRVHLLLDKMTDSGLYLESAILHGKLEEHDKALKILVHQLKDFPAAEDYCMWTAERKDVLYRQRLFHLLLSVYLNPDSSDDSLRVAGVDLINKHSAEFDTAQVLKLLPGTWSVQLLAPFLAGSMRKSIHKQKMARLAVGLAKAENLIYKHEMVKMRGYPIVLSDKSVCHICRSPIQEPTFTRYPNGSIVHTYCTPSQHVNNTDMAHEIRT